MIATQPDTLIAATDRLAHLFAPRVQCHKCGDYKSSTAPCKRCSINPAADLVILAGDDWEDIESIFRKAAHNAIADREASPLKVDIQNAQRWPSRERFDIDGSAVAFESCATRDIGGRLCCVFSVDVV